MTNNPNKDERLEKRQLRLVSKGRKAVDEGREKKAYRLLGRAADIEDRRIRRDEKWEDSIKNPENREFVVETAFNNNKKPKNVTQKEFNERYDIPKKRFKLRLKK